jgi:hypothetical protein
MSVVMLHSLRAPSVMIVTAYRVGVRVRVRVGAGVRVRVRVRVRVKVRIRARVIRTIDHEQVVTSSF